MPRFPVAFSRRKSSVENVDHGTVAGPSFRVLDRSEVAGSPKSPDSDHLTVRRPAKSRTMPANLGSDAMSVDDNIFADLKNNRGSGSGSSNTTKTASTDNSSRHSNASTAPSSADLSAHNQQQQQQHEDWRQSGNNAYGGIPVPPIPKSNTSSSFLKSAGRTFSFGGPKKAHPLSPAHEDRSPVSTPPDKSGRNRAATASTVSTATPPKLEEEFTLDLGGDFSKMLGGFDKRASVLTVRDDGAGRAALAPRSLTANRLNQPLPMQLDSLSKVEPSPYSWGSHNSNDQLLQSTSARASPTNENAPPVPRHTSLFGNRSEKTAATATVPVSESAPALPSSSDSSLKRSSAVMGRRRSTIDYAPDIEDEDTVLLKDSFSTVSKFLNNGNSSSVVAKSSATVASRFRRNEDFLGTGYRQVPTESTSPTEFQTHVDEDNLFDLPLGSTRKPISRPDIRHPSPPQTKVMTPAQFERYRKDKEREESSRVNFMPKSNEADEDDDEDNYDEDEIEDEAEKLRQAAKQRRKQEAHMTVYRQQMMKVTGEAASGTPARLSMPSSVSTPNLTSIAGGNGAIGPGPSPQGGSDVSDDEEVPLAILAAHGFPNKNRPPTRLSTMMSNPNLRAAATASYQRPSSASGEMQAVGGAGGRLPPFARNLPQDPYGLVNPPVRETLQFAGGAPAAVPRSSSPLPHGGLIGVIVNEERSRAMRRGSPHVDGISKPMPNSATGGQFDPMGGIPPHMMYPGMGQPQMLSPGDQAQIQMTQQMQQFMQMQMQFMQMMASGGNAMQQRPESHYSNASGMNPMMASGGMGGMGGMGGPDMMRPSFMDNGSMVDVSGQLSDPRNMRTMSMVQPSSSSWVQPLALNPGLTPSIRLQGTNGYAPSIAPSERSNVGLPGRYRPVSHMPTASQSSDLRRPTMSGALGAGAAGAPVGEDTTPGTASPPVWDQSRKQTNRSPLNNSSNVNADDDDDEVGWAAMKAKREKKISLWKSKKTLGSDIGALIT